MGNGITTHSQGPQPLKSSAVGEVCGQGPVLLEGYEGRVLYFLVAPCCSVSGFFGTVRPENPETDWDDNPGKPTLVIPVRHQVRNISSVHPTTIRVSSEIRSENYSSAYPTDDTPVLPWGVIPVRFGVFPAFFGPQNPKWTRMTRLGFPGLSSQW